MFLGYHIINCPLLGGCYVYSSKINRLHSEKVIISGVKVFISGHYIKSLYWKEQEHNTEQSTIVEC